MIDRLRWLYRAWRYRLKVEVPEIRWLLENLEPGDIVVDAGAHKGAFTYWMLRKVGPEGKVFAFEPQPQLAARLSALIRQSGSKNVVVEQKGLSSKASELDLLIPGHGSSPSASFEKTGDSTQPGHKVTVEVTTLDSYLGENRPFRVGLIKCDAEGHELEVFRGARRILREDRPDLLFESETRHLGNDTPIKVFSFLEELGYRGFFFGPDGFSDINGFDPAVHQANPGGADYVNNFLFVHEDRGL